MKGSEAILRAIATAGGSIPAVQFDLWMGQLLKAGLVKKAIRDDRDVFHYELTEPAKLFLRKKGVAI